MTCSVLIAARRSPIAPRNGALSHLLAHELAAPVIQAALADCGVAPDQVDELILSNALGAGGNPARVSALAAGLPDRVAGLTIDRQCAGGLDALMLADALVRSGQHQIVIAGGVESYSRRPLRAHTFADGRAPEPYDQAPFTPWPDRDPNMADAADRLAQSQNIDRETQDAWAIRSHQKAMQSKRDLGILPLCGVNSDPFTRNLTPRHCARVPQVSGSITAANMAVAADAAAVVVVASAQTANALGLKGVRILGGQTIGGDPKLPGLAPVAAVQSVLQQTNLRAPDIQTAEIMEAFAVQTIACQRGAGLSPDIVNPDGGALARGHPIGASGAVLAVHLFHQLSQNAGHGLAAIAAAGGLGTALLLRG
jgi:acetyl-CoA C-acetyltransferase